MPSVSSYPSAVSAKPFASNAVAAEENTGSPSQVRSAGPYRWKVTFPGDDPWKPLSVAVSVSASPKRAIVGSWSVVIPGVALATMLVSLASLQLPAMGRLVVLPPKLAIQRYVPAVVGVKLAGPNVPFAFAANADEVKAAVPVQFGSFGP